MTEASTATATAEPANTRQIVDEAFAAFNSGGQHVESFSARYPALNLSDAYRATALINARRVAEGYKPAGRKVGFTNHDMWNKYGVRAPIWGYVYDRTIHDLTSPLPLAPYTEPKIEPEIMFGLASAPSPGMDDAAVLSCIAWVAHGFEIVQSIFPNWTFSAADTVIADALHGALLIGRRLEIGTRMQEWLHTLREFEVELYCDGELVERGNALNVLEGPLSAVRHLVNLLALDPDNPPLAAGEIISTGTLTLARSVSPSELWTTKLKGIELEGVSLRLC